MGDRDETHTATVPDPSPGTESTHEPEVLPTVLGDRYQIESRLGAGGMGVVYSARDIQLGREVAIKVVGPRIDSASARGRLVREAQAMAKLRHPNIATVHDIGASGDRLFFVMELVEGGTLADWLRAERRSWRQIVAVLLQAAHGLSAAHAAGFVHRDFKPENVLIGKDGGARVSDFGVSRLVGEAERLAPAEDGAGQQTVTGSQGVVGTPGYVAPEILRHEPVDARADQFSFCVAAYVSMHGERPFEALEGPGRIAETLGKLRPPRAGIGPGWMQRIIRRGLAGDPRDRWPTMAALTEAIERRLGYRRRALVLTGVGLAALAAIATAWMTSRPSPVPAPDWLPVVIERDTKDSPRIVGVSPDGSTLMSFWAHEARVWPRTAPGSPRRVTLPYPDTVPMCRLSRTGDHLFCGFDVGTGGFEVWELDVATGHPERRVPPVGAPPLKLANQFDVGPGGSVFFGVVDGSAVWRADKTGAVEQVVAAEPGQKFAEYVVSPDGTRIALNIVSPEGYRIGIVNTGARTVAIVSHRGCRTIEWLTERSLACLPQTYRRPEVIELLLPAGSGEATERVRYLGPEYQLVSTLYTSSAGVVMSIAPLDQHLALVALDGPGKVRPTASGAISDLSVAGWTSSGSMIFGANLQGQLRILGMRPDGTVETIRIGPAAEVPLVVLGDTIVFGRFPGGESVIPFLELPMGRRYPDGELFRFVPGGAVENLGKTHNFIALVCAGGRSTPCLLAEYSGDDVIAVEWNPETGARGPERTRWSMMNYTRYHALSPDGRTLAQVERFLGLLKISLLDLDSGKRRRVDIPGTYLCCPRWHPDGTLLAQGWGEGRPSGIVRVGAGDEIETLAVFLTPDVPYTSADEFHVSPDGKTAAVLTGVSSDTHYWVPRPPD